MSRAAQDLLNDARDDEVYVASLARQHYGAAASTLREEFQELAGDTGHGTRLRKLAQLLALAVPTGTSVSIDGLTYSIRAYEYGPYRYRVLEDGDQAVGDLGSGIASLSRLHRFGEHCDALVEAFTAQAVKQANPELHRPALTLLALLGEKPPRGPRVPAGSDCIANIVRKALDDLEQHSRNDDPHFPTPATTMQIAAFLSVMEKGWCGTSEIAKVFNQAGIHLQRYEHGGEGMRSPYRLPRLVDELAQMRQRCLQYGSTPIHLPVGELASQLNPTLEQKVALLGRVNGMGKQNRSLAKEALARLCRELYGCGQLPLKKPTAHGDLVIELKGKEVCVRLGRAVITGPTSGWRQHQATTAEFATCLDVLQDVAVASSMKIREQALTQKAAGLRSGALSLLE